MTALSAFAARALARCIEGRVERRVTHAVGARIGPAEAIGARVVDDERVVVKRVI